MIFGEQNKLQIGTALKGIKILKVRNLVMIFLKKENVLTGIGLGFSASILWRRGVNIRQASESSSLLKI